MVIGVAEQPSDGRERAGCPPHPSRRTAPAPTLIPVRVPIVTIGEAKAARAGSTIRPRPPCGPAYIRAVVVYQPETLGQCCSLGAVLQGSFERARERFAAVSGDAEDPEQPGVTAAMTLVALVNLCDHRIDVHEADPGPVRGCAVCTRFELSVPADPRAGGPRLNPTAWTYERRVHHVAHVVAPHVVRMVS